MTEKLRHLKNLSKRSNFTGRRKERKGEKEKIRQVIENMLSGKKVGAFRLKYPTE